MNLAFLILMTFYAPTTGGLGHVEIKQIRCKDMACVEKYERDAKDSTTLRRFQVYERGRDGRAETSGVSIFPPIIDWGPG